MAEQVIFEDMDDPCRYICLACHEEQACPRTGPQPITSNDNGPRRLLSDEVMAVREWTDPIDQLRFSDDP